MVGATNAMYNYWHGRGQTRTKTTVVEKFDKAGKCIEKTTTTETIYDYGYQPYYHQPTIWYSSAGATTNALGDTKTTVTYS